MTDIRNAAHRKTCWVHTGSPVGETVVDAVARELARVGLGQDEIALEASVDDLANDVLVGEANNKAVLRRIVLVLGLGDQALAGVVVGLALASTPVLRLVPAGNKRALAFSTRDCSTLKI